MCAGVSSGGKFRKVPESSGVCWCRQVPEGSGEFRCAGFRSSRRLRRVPVRAGVWRQGSEGSGELRCGLLPCNLVRGSDCFEYLLVITLSTWAKPLRKENGAHESNVA